MALRQPYLFKTLCLSTQALEQMSSNITSETLERDTLRWCTEVGSGLNLKLSTKLERNTRGRIHNTEFSSKLRMAG
jgi:hypothetical protein